MALGEIFGRSWKEYWGNFRAIFKFLVVYLGIPGLLLTVITIIYGVMNMDIINLLGDPDAILQMGFMEFFRAMMPYFVLLIITSIITFLLTTYITKGVITLSLKKDRYGFFELAGAGKQGYGRFLGFTVVYWIFLILLFIALFVPGIIFGVFWALASYIFINENKGISESLGRSMKLIKGRWWKTLGYILILLLIAFGIGLVLSMLSIPLVVLFTISSIGNGQISVPLYIASALMDWLTNFLATLFFVPFGIIFFKNYYLELKRLRRL